MAKNTLGHLKMGQGVRTMLEKAKTSKIGPDDIREQRASFAFSSIKNRETVTRESVKQFVIEYEGGATESTGDTDRHNR